MKIFSLLSLCLILLVGVTAVSAVDDIDAAADVDVSNDVVNTVDNDKIVKDEIQDTSKLSADVSGSTVTKNVSNYAELVSAVKNVKGASDYKINLKKGTYTITETIKYNNKIPLTVNGNGATVTGNKRFFEVSGSTTVITIANFTVQNVKSGDNNAAGIALMAPSTLKVDNCKFINCTGNEKGGAITNRGTTTITNSVFSGNVGRTGSAIWSTGEYGGSLTIKNSNFTGHKVANSLNNNQDNRMGVIYALSKGKVTIDGCVFSSNNGRSIHLYNGVDSTVSNNRFTGNTITARSGDAGIVRGGLIDNYEATLKLTDNIFESSNVVSGAMRGGVLYNEIGKTTITGNTFSNTIRGANDNTYAGAVYNRNSTITVSNNKFDCTVTANTVRGGAIYNNIGTITLTANTFTNKINGNNVRGGAGYNDKGSTLTDTANTYQNTISDTKGLINKTIYNDGTYKKGSLTATKITANAVSGVIGTPFNVTATVKDANNKAVTGGYVIFKLNGKTLKTSAGVDIQAPVSNGAASLKVVQNLRDTKYTVQAIYSGSTVYNGSRSAQNTVTLAKRNATITLSLNQSSVQAGQKVNITVSVKDKNGSAINAGYVNLKVNGKSLVNSKNQSLNLTVKNGVVNYVYTVPGNYSSKDYTITASYSEPTYNVVKQDKTLSVVQTPTEIQVTRITGNTKNLTVKARVFAKGTTTNIKNPATVIIKLNGKTLKDVTGATLKFNVTNGNINFVTDLTNVSAKEYNVTIVLGDTNIYSRSEVTSKVTFTEAK